MNASGKGTDAPQVHQHRKPMCNDGGHCIGYTDWREGRGLPGWPHRVLAVATQTI